MRRAPFALLLPMKVALSISMAASLTAVIAAGAALTPAFALAQEGTTRHAPRPEVEANRPAGGAPAEAPPTGRGSAPAAADQPLAERCESPEEIAPAQERIDDIAAAIGAGPQPLSIVVLGSLSIQDLASRGPTAFATRLQEILQAKLARRGIGRLVEVRHVGRPRALAADLARLVDREVLPLQPALVIWQTGRSDPRKGNPPHRFAQGLKEGIAALRKAGIPVIIGDIQFHPQFEALFRTDDYRNYVRWIAGKHELPLLRRYEMIEEWSLSDRIDLDSGDDGDQQRAYAFIQECLAFQAARMIVGAAGLGPGKPQGGT